MTRMQGAARVAKYALIVALIPACKIGEMLQPDASQGSGSDGSGDTVGLNVTWDSEPQTFPNDVGGNITAASASFKVDTFRVIGDAGSSATTKNTFTIKWDDTGGPAPISFPDAPTGIYSRVSINADGHVIDDSYTIRGTAQVGGTTYPFEISDRNALNVSLNINQTLPPGGGAAVKITLVLTDALQQIDWTQVNLDSGKLELETTDPQMPAFRASLLQGFKVATSTID